MSMPEAMPAGRQVSIIIVNYNTAKEIEKCLNSVLTLRQAQAFGSEAQARRGDAEPFGGELRAEPQSRSISSQPSAHSLEIIVIDNASTDNSCKVIKNFAEIKLIKNEKNLGFSKANNIGAKAAIGDFLFFLNPDTQVKGETIQKLLEFGRKNPNTILGPKLENPDGSLQASCYNLPKISGAISEFWFGKKGTYEKFTPVGRRPCQVEAIVGAAMFMPKNTFEKLGGFDEKYFLYYEDLDFCRRAAKAKIPIYYYPAATLIHGLGKAGGDIKQLKQSAKIYHGFFKYFILTLIIRGGQIWQKFLNRI